MERQPRLSRSEVIARLREQAARHGAVSPGLLATHDPIVLRSVRLHFPSFDAARRAAGVPAARPAATVRRKHRSPKAVWSRRRVHDELRRLDRDGTSTAWADLMQTGRGDLVAAATTYAGGLRRARAQAGVAPRVRRLAVPRWNKRLLVHAIRDRVRKRQTLTSSKAPARFVATAHWHFKS